MVRQTVKILTFREYLRARACPVDNFSGGYRISFEALSGHACAGFGGSSRCPCEEKKKALPERIQKYRPIWIAKFTLKRRMDIQYKKVFRVKKFSINRTAEIPTL